MKVSVKKIGAVTVMSAFVLFTSVWSVQAHSKDVLAQENKLSQQQADLQTRATDKAVAIANKQAQAETEAKKVAAEQAEEQAKAEQAATEEAQATSAVEPEASTPEADVQATQNEEAVDTPTQGGSEDAQSSTSTPMPQPTLSFADAGRAVVNQGCSGFFVSPTEVVTASHCALSSSSVQLAATGETYSASISQNVPGKDFAVLSVDHANTQAPSLWKRAASAGEGVTVYSRLNGAFQASIVTQEVGTVTVNGDGTTQLNFGDGSLGSTINAINAPVSVGDSGSIVIGNDGAYLGVIAGSDLSSMSYFVS